MTRSEVFCFFLALSRFRRSSPGLISIAERYQCGDVRGSLLQLDLEGGVTFPSQQLLPSFAGYRMAGEIFVPLRSSTFDRIKLAQGVS
jgi:hypothetical protein